ncbi:cystathionine gamma-synthase [Pelagivirga sediminicola]|uniref:Cystathionine gamma-synthase n=1 Tax=Pelagivirga sediminicola TaxID=2170575 RepID=A0A2T7G5M7_9RHOB|nr:aminotransferase class I/II-fold pyridoxal phosphate-dependent enzyme [Pelagivirga sediminicola]PVA09686.1 cystathionine gamma-synthase [Pelagivirga sediminicola]
MSDRKNRPLSPATRLAQALHHVEERTGALTPTIQLSATYARGADYAPRQPYIYRRDSNETTEHAEAIIADLEGAAATLLFASGMSAAGAVLEALPSGAHVVAPGVMYHGVLQQMQKHQTTGRLAITHYTAGDLDAMKAAIRPGQTALIWVETPNNPDWTVTDIAAAAAIAHEAGARLITDCTATPPCCTRALELGADISFHSATKYLNGHSDVTAGALSVRRAGALWDAIADVRKLQGTVLHSFDAWLLIRGMRTLTLRVERQTENALAIARHFEGDPRLEAVLYPGLASHPGHDIARRQTDGMFGGMLSIIVKGGERAAIDTALACRLFYPATSLGGVESLIEHRKTVSGPGFDVHPALLRLSVGIEHAPDLIDDLEQALDAAT